MGLDHLVAVFILLCAIGMLVVSPFQRRKGRKGLCWTLVLGGLLVAYLDFIFYFFLSG